MYEVGERSKLCNEESTNCLVKRKLISNYTYVKPDGRVVIKEGTY